jgi:hypothetical protein
MALGLCLGAFEVAFRSFQAPPLSYWFPLFPLAVFCYFKGKSIPALLLLIGGGFVWDLFPLGGTSFAVGGYLLLALGLHFIAKNVITNQSVYSAVALCLVARLLSWIASLALSFAGRILLSHSMLAIEWTTLWHIFVWDSLFLAVLFFVDAYIFAQLFVRRETRAFGPTWYA